MQHYILTVKFQNYHKCLLTGVSRFLLACTYFCTKHFTSSLVEAKPLLDFSVSRWANSDSSFGIAVTTPCQPRCELTCFGLSRRVASFMPKFFEASLTDMVPALIVSRAASTSPGPLPKFLTYFLTMVKLLQFN